MKHSVICCAVVAVAAMSSCQSASNTENPAKVLVVVDVQRDFFDPSGALYVGGSEVLPEKIAAIAPDYDAVIFTLDWHPANHCSYAAQGGIWPSHCVAFTQGAGLPDCFSPILRDQKTCIFLKGTEADKEQYGAFEEFSSAADAKLWLENCESVDVCGIAGDYCVKESTANILKVVPAQKVSILTDCVRSIDGGAALEAFIQENGLGRK